MRVPADHPVRPIRRGSKAESMARAAGTLAECGSCRRMWDDSISTSMTPAPSGRCPFEYFHRIGGGS